MDRDARRTEMLRLGAQKWEIYRRGECKQCQPFAGMRGRFAARQWLQQFRGNALCMGALRHGLSREGSVSWRLDRATDDDILDQAAQLLAAGVWHVHAPEGIHAANTRSPGAGAGAAGGLAGAPEKSRQPFEMTRQASEVRRPALVTESRAPKSPPNAGLTSMPKLSWIEIQLVGADGKPISGVEYEIKLPDGSIKSGTLNAKGLTRHDNIVAGQCQVRFPKLDAGEWQPA